MKHEFVEIPDTVGREIIDDFEYVSMQTGYKLPLKTFYDSLDESIREIPEEYRKDLQIIFEVDEDYGELSVSCHLWYKRPETDAEVFDRKICERGKEEAEIEKAYQILKKYGR